MDSSKSINSIYIITQSVKNVFLELIKQSIDINTIDDNTIIPTESLFEGLKGNDLKINRQIEKITKSLVIGLNFSQVIANTIPLSKIIENCINIKNSSIYKCPKSSIKVNLIKDNNTVTIDDASMRNLTKYINNCIINDKETENIRKLTDLEIQKLTPLLPKTDTSFFCTYDSKIIGFIIIMILAYFKILSSSSKMNKIIGPIIMTIGAAISWFVLKQKKLVNIPFYIKNSIKNLPNIGDLKQIKTDKIKNNNNEPTFYGDADIYETFNKTITLYEGGNVNNIQNNIFHKDLELSLQGTNLNIKINNSNHPVGVVDLKFTPLTIGFLPAPPESNSGNYTDNTVYVFYGNFNFAYKITIYKKLQDKPLEFVQDYFLEPTIVSYHQKIEITQNPQIIFGISLILLGIIIIFSGR